MVSPRRGYPWHVRRRVLGLIAVAVVVVGGVAIAAVSRGDGKPSRPAQLGPAQLGGDDANIMRRLQRDKLMKQAKQGK
jgi:hypothetical protein